MPTLDLIARFIGVDAGAGAEFEKVSHAAEGSSLAWAKYAAAAVVGAGTVAAVSIEMADKFEEAHTRLESAVQNVGGNMDALGGQVDALDSRMEKLGFTNTDVQSGLAGLVTATKSPARAIHDMALAADLARGRNIDLAAATSTLVKVETGHVSLLGRLGINTKNAAGETITQEQALQRLTDLYGGDASRYAETFGGKVATLKAQAQDLGIKLGMVLVPAVTDLVKVISGGAQVIGDVAKFLERNKTAAILLAAVIESALIPAEVRWLATNAKLIASNIGVKVSGLTNGIGGLAGSMKSAEGASGKLGAVWATSAGKAGIIGAAVVGLYEGGKTLGHILNTTTTPSVQQFNAAVVSLADGVGQAGPQMVAMFTGLSKAGGMASGLVDQFAQKWDTAMTGLVTSGHADQAASAFDALSTSLKAAGWSTERITKEFPQYTAALQDSKTSAEAAGTGTDQFGNAVSKAAKKAAAASAAVTTLTNRIDTLIGGPLAEHAAAAQFATDLQKMAKAAKDNTGRISDTTRAGQANAAMLRTLAGDVQTSIQNWVKQGDTAKQIRPKLLDLEKQLRSTANATTGNKAAVDRYLQSMNLAPGQIGKLLNSLSALGHGMDAAKAKAGADGQATGRDYVDGVRLGLANAAGALEAEAASLGNLVNTAFRSHEGISAHSPSKKGHQSGKDYGQGVANGVAQSAKIVQLSALKVAKVLDEALQHGWHGLASSIRNSLSSKVQNDLTRFTDHLTHELDRQTTALGKAEDKYKSLVKAQRSGIASLASSIAGNADISNVLNQTRTVTSTSGPDFTGGTFTPGETTTTDVAYTGNIKHFLTQQLGPLKAEAKGLARLRKMGLSQSLISQISQLAPPDAVSLINQILSGQDGSIGHLNALQHHIQSLAKQTATTVVKSPQEREAILVARQNLHWQHVAVQEQRKTNRHLEKLVAHGIAGNTTVKVSGGSVKHLTMQDAAALRKLLNKYDHSRGHK